MFLVVVMVSHRVPLLFSIQADDADPRGSKLETISDLVDDINVAKLKQRDTNNAYEDSAFDAGKDKAGFRQFVDSNESSRRFYM
jgi:inositol oxygenase